MNSTILTENKKKVIWWLVLAAIAAFFCWYAVSHQEKFITPFDHIRMGKTYSQSQYVIGELSKGGIGDDGVYAFAGYYYVFQGGDVSSVNFEHPPLGKYLIGLSVFVTKNENAINLIYFSLILFLTYRIALLLLKDSYLSILTLIPVAIDPLFLDHLLRSQLELPFSVFLLAAVYFFLRAAEKKRYIYWSMICWGAAFSTRFFPALVIFWGFMLAFTWKKRREHLRDFLTASFLIPLIYLITHISFFVYHPSLLEFIRHKKWMLAWYRGTPVITGNIWQNIFTGWYLDSTWKLARNEYWNILIPVVTILSLIPKSVRSLGKQHQSYLFVFIFSILYLLYVTFLTNGLQKFIMPVYPLLSILAVGSIVRLYSIIKSPDARRGPHSHKRKTR